MSLSDIISNRNNLKYDVIGKHFNRWGETYEVTSDVYTFTLKRSITQTAGVCVRAKRIVSISHGRTSGNEIILFNALDSLDKVFWQTVKEAKENYIVDKLADIEQLLHINKSLNMYHPIK